MPEHLIDGLRRFHAETFPRYREHYQTLVEEGQKPTTLFIGCADSRVVPDLLTDAEPGELFIVRNVGAFVPPFEPDGSFHGTAAGIEYAVLVLGVTDIVVCGHSHCGAIRALYDRPDPRAPHIARWLELGLEARVAEATGQADPTGALERPAGSDAPFPDREALLRTEQRSVALQLERLFTYPFIEERVSHGTLSLHGWHYIIEEGQVLALDIEQEAFVPLSGAGS